MAQNHPIADIRGLDDEMRAKLVALGIHHSDQLIARAGHAQGRVALANELGIDRSQVTEWVNRADLMRLKGVGRQYSNLLEDAGVDSCKELQRRIPANLHAKLAEINAAQQVVERTPTEKQVADWIAEAKELEATAPVEAAPA